MFTKNVIKTSQCIENIRLELNIDQGFHARLRRSEIPRLEKYFRYFTNYILYLQKSSTSKHFMSFSIKQKHGAALL